MQHPNGRPVLDPSQIGHFGERLADDGGGQVWIEQLQLG
jgi:hypothetical protein